MAMGGTYAPVANIPLIGVGSCRHVGASDNGQLDLEGNSVHLLFASRNRYKSSLMHRGCRECRNFNKTQQNRVRTEDRFGGLRVFSIMF